MEHESTTGETTRWQRADPGILFADTISDIVDVLKRLSTAIEHHDPDSVEGAVRLSVCMWLTAHTAHRQLIERSEGDMADRSGSLLEARGSLLELSVRATTAIAAPRLGRLLGELQQAFSAADINPMGRAACRPDRRTTTRCEPPFSVVQVEPDFSPQSYVATFMALQRAPEAKLLDLTPARLLCADVFERLAGAWTARPDAVPRLAILLSFERWVMLREIALAALKPLIASGIWVGLFYQEQGRHCIGSA